jgi:predicted dehydrogenase
VPAVSTDRPVGVGVVGCGVISKAYLQALRAFPDLALRAVADLRPDAAAARAAEFGVPALSPGELLADPGVELVLNLTTPEAHGAVGRAALAAGKHVYSEKPLAEARRLLLDAKARGLRLGCAPDTFLAGPQQTARALIDRGAIGEIVGGTAFLQLAGHERWHPDPAFYYARDGGGPVLDMGPYYVTALVNLLGPVARVMAMGRTVRAARTVATDPHAGRRIPVGCTTHVVGVMELVAGPLVQIAMSFEVWGHRHPPLEIYGTRGSLAVPDPNRFDGVVELLDADGAWQPVSAEHGYAEGDLRGLGVADMARALRVGRPHRCDGELAFHVLEVLEALHRAAEGADVVDITSRCPRPAPLPPGLAHGQLD